LLPLWFLPVHRAGLLAGQIKIADVVQNGVWLVIDSPMVAYYLKN
jgi:hypothetical protein